MLAYAIAAMIEGTGLPLWAAPAFALLALLRAGADYLAQSRVQAAARALVSSRRRQLLALISRRAPAGAAEDAAGLASLIGEKIALIGPWAERFIPALIRVRLLPFVILIAVASQSWTAALALAFTGPLIPLFMVLIGYAAQAVSQAQLIETGALSRLLVDRIAALSDIRLLGAGAQAESDLALRAGSLRERTMKVLRLAFLSSTVLEFMAALGVAMVALQTGLSLLGLVSWGGWGGQISTFGGIFILLLAPDFYQPLRDLAAGWHDRASAEAVFAELKAEENRDIPEYLGAASAPAALALTAPLEWHGLVVAPGGTRQITLPDGGLGPGESLALVAPSGAGKSTLLAALAGLYPPAAGEIRLGGVTLDHDSAAQIRQSLGWLPQVPRFPAMTLGRWLGDAPAETIATALRLARADGVVAGLPMGLMTRLGERGGGVSGGEARRLMIARALIARPAVLLADEPTADLDRDTAAQVTEALLALRDQGTALLVATHDPALAEAMGRQIRFGDGGTA